MKFSGAGVQVGSVQVSYATGHWRGRGNFGHGRDFRYEQKFTRRQLTELVRQHFDLMPYGLRQMLDLARPIYEATAGHFGREEAEFTWERTDRAQALAADAGLALNTVAA